ncbi:MAG: C45 family peptidase [Rhizomicrobium sp.]
METSALEIITLEGGPTARGRQHGEMLRPRIHALLDRWDEALRRVYKVTRARHVERFFAETKFERALQAHAPSVLEEIRGIAEGAAVDYPTLLAFQHINEEFWFAPSAAPPGEACSTMALGPTGTQPALIGQNLDLDAYLDGYQLLLRYRCDNSDGRILAPSVPGMISLNGMNSHGFAVCDNTLTRLRTDIAGVPIFAIYRLLLESTSLPQAVALIERLPHASGLNWVIGDPEAVAMYERSAGTIVKYGPDDPSQPVYHTNHPLKNCDVAGAVGRKPGRSTYLRFAALHERFSALDAPLGIPAIKEILSGHDDPDYPVSRGGGRNEEDENIGFTLACCIFELDAERPRLHIASGPPHRCEFRTFSV